MASSRRAVLRTGGAGCVALTSGATAGCLDWLPFVGGDHVIDDWLLEPDPTAVREWETYRDHTFRERRYRYLEPATVIVDSPLSGEELPGYLLREWLGIDPANVEWQLEQRVVWELTIETQSGAVIQETARPDVEVLAGDFDVDAVVDHLEAETSGITSVPTLEDDFRCYEGGTFRYALSGDHLVRTQANWLDPDAVLDAVLAVKVEEEDGPRWDGAVLEAVHDEREDGERIDGAVFAPDEGNEPWEDGLVGRTRSVTVEGADSELSDGFRYGDKPQSTALSEALETDEFVALEDESLEVEGQWVHRTGRAESDMALGVGW